MLHTNIYCSMSLPETCFKHRLSNSDVTLRRRSLKYKLATFYSRTGESCTTLDDGELDFRVRNGNGYDFSSMVTSKKLLVGN